MLDLSKRKGKMENCFPFLSDIKRNKIKNSEKQKTRKIRENEGKVYQFHIFSAYMLEILS
jgi:uncharacterized protein YeeX (DUF496 family)